MVVQGLGSGLLLVGTLVCLSGAGCSDGPVDTGGSGATRATSAGARGGGGPEPWPWLATYESPGCSNPDITCTTFTDERDGKVYRSVTIASQTWMGSALNYGEFSAEPVEASPGFVPKQCPFDDPSWCDRAGAEYRWSVAMDLPTRCEEEDCDELISAPHRGICPTGWHMPTLDEVSTLLDGVRGDDEECTGMPLKSTQGWTYGGEDDPATDASGLSVLPQEMSPNAGTVWAVRAGIWTAESNSGRFRLLSLSVGAPCAYVDEVISSNGWRRYTVRCVAD